MIHLDSNGVKMMMEAINKGELKKMLLEYNELEEER